MTFQEIILVILIISLFCAFVFSIFLFSKKLKKNLGIKAKLIEIPKSVSVYLPFLFGVLLIGAIFLFYKLEINPVLVLTASEFKSREAENIKMLQDQNDALSLNKVSQKFIIFDLRQPEETYKGQIKGATPVAYSEFIKLDNTIKPIRKVVVFSASNRLKEAQEVAKRLSSQDLPKIYVISDGYEGLVKAGLKQKEKPGFEEE